MPNENNQERPFQKPNSFSPEYLINHRIKDWLKIIPTQPSPTVSTLTTAIKGQINNFRIAKTEDNRIMPTVHLDAKFAQVAYTGLKAAQLLKKDESIIFIKQAATFITTQANNYTSIARFLPESKDKEHINHLLIELKNISKDIQTTSRRSAQAQVKGHVENIHTILTTDILQEENAWELSRQLFQKVNIFANNLRKEGINDTASTLNYASQGFELISLTGRIFGNDNELNQVAVIGQTAVALISNFSTVAESITNIASTVAVANPVGIGITAGLTIITGLINLFRSSSSEHMDEIKQEIKALGKTLCSKLDKLQADLASHHREMLNQFRNVASQLGDIDSKMDIIKADVKKLQRYVEDSDRQKQLDTYEDFVRNEVYYHVQYLNDPLTTYEANMTYGKLMGWLHIHFQKGTLGSDLENYNKERFYNNIRIEKLGFYINLITGYYHEHFGNKNKCTKLANPILWVDGVINLMKFIDITPEFKFLRLTVDSKSYHHQTGLKEILKDGQALADFLAQIKINKKGLFEKLCKDYNKQVFEVTYQAYKLLLNEHEAKEGVVIKNYATTTKNNLDILNEKIKLLKEEYVQQYLPKLLPNLGSKKDMCPNLIKVYHSSLQQNLSNPSYFLNMNKRPLTEALLKDIEDDKSHFFHKYNEQIKDLAKLLGELKANPPTSLAKHTVPLTKVKVILKELKRKFKIFKDHIKKEIESDKDHTKEEKTKPHKNHKKKKKSKSDKNHVKEEKTKLDELKEEVKAVLASIEKNNSDQLSIINAGISAKEENEKAFFAKRKTNKKVMKKYLDNADKKRENLKKACHSERGELSASLLKLDKKRKVLEIFVKLAFEDEYALNWKISFFNKLWNKAIFENLIDSNDFILYREKKVLGDLAIFKNKLLAAVAHAKTLYEKGYSNDPVTDTLKELKLFEIKYFGIKPNGQVDMHLIEEFEQSFERNVNKNDSFEEKQKANLESEEEDIRASKSKIKVDDLDLINSSEIILRPRKKSKTSTDNISPSSFYRSATKRSAAFFKPHPVPSKRTRGNESELYESGKNNTFVN